MRVSRQLMVRRLRDRVGLTGTDAAACLETVLTIIERALVAGDNLRLVGFGLFTVRQRAARITVHPGTGKPVEVPSRPVVQFRPAKAMKELIDQTAPGRPDTPEPATG
jgi:DNA-binding protein HU-beta